MIPWVASNYGRSWKLDRWFEFDLVDKREPSSIVSERRDSEVIARDWTFLSSPNAYIEAVILSVMVFEGQTFERSWGLDEVMSVESPRRVWSLSWGWRDQTTLSPPCGIEQDGGLPKARERTLTRTLFLHFPPPELWETSACCLSHPVCGSLW